MPSHQALDFLAVSGRLVPVAPGPLPVYQVLRTVASPATDIVGRAPPRGSVSHPCRRFTYLGRTVPGVGFLQQLLEPGSIGSHLLRASVRRGLPLVTERLTRFRQR
jgi:hypothetical protein